MWHIDSYDKLKPFGFCIHGCIAGFSRRIIRLEVGSTNNDSRVEAKYFLNCIRQIRGTAAIHRADYGTENVLLSNVFLGVPVLISLRETKVQSSIGSRHQISGLRLGGVSCEKIAQSGG